MNRAQRRLVVWGTVVFALVLHLSFFRWGWDLMGVEVSTVKLWVRSDANPAEAPKYKSRHRVGLYWSELGERHPTASVMVGVLAPLALVGVAGYFYLGGRELRTRAV